MNSLKHMPENIAKIPSVCVAFNLRNVSRQVTKFYQEKMRRLGIQGTQFPLLLAIKLNQPISITALADLLDIDRTTMSRNLKILAKQEAIFIGRQVSDHRQRTVALTAKGLSLLEDAIPLWHEAQHDIVERFGQESWEQLLNLLAKLSSVTK